MNKEKENKEESKALAQVKKAQAEYSDALEAWSRGGSHDPLAVANMGNGATVLALHRSVKRAQAKVQRALAKLNKIRGY